jgi:hypothetical protein
MRRSAVPQFSLSDGQIGVECFSPAQWDVSSRQFCFFLRSRLGMPKMGLKLQCGDSRRRVVFAFLGLGFAGHSSQGELDFRIIAAQEKEVALAAFENLVASENPQDAPYGLSGIRKLSPGRLQEPLPDSLKSSMEVETMSGCIIRQESSRQR